MLSFSISYWDLIKIPYLVDTTEKRGYWSERRPRRQVTLQITLMSQVPCPLTTLRKMWHVYMEEDAVSVLTEHVMLWQYALLLGIVWCFVTLESLSMDIPRWVCSQFFFKFIFRTQHLIVDFIVLANHFGPVQNHICWTSDFLGGQFSLVLQEFVYDKTWKILLSVKIIFLKRKFPILMKSNIWIWKTKYWVSSLNFW
jgi:hypothetical protein